MELTKGMIVSLKDAAAKLTGAKRRAFQAQVTRDYLNGRPRQAAAGRAGFWLGAANRRDRIA